MTEKEVREALVKIKSTTDYAKQTAVEVFENIKTLVSVYEIDTGDTCLSICLKDYLTHKEVKEYIKKCLESEGISATAGFIKLLGAESKYYVRSDDGTLLNLTPGCVYTLITKLISVLDNKPSPEELQKQVVINRWREHKDYFMEYFSEDNPITGLAAEFFAEMEKYADLTTCPYCKEQNVEAFIDDELEQGHCRWRLQCQHCGLETPELEDAEEVLDVWDKFKKMFNKELEKISTQEESKKTNWVDELPDKEKFIEFLKDAGRYMWSIGVNSDETHQLIMSVLESLGVKDNEDV